MSDFRVLMVGDTHIEAPGGYDARDLLNGSGADQVFQVGDWVQHGRESEYEVATAWARQWDAPFALVRGNHDSGRWNRHARRACPGPIAAALDAHGRDEQMAMLEWRPLVWLPVGAPAVKLARTDDWSQVPATIQPHIVKLRDLTPGYYTLDRGDMRFVCLDTSNWLLGDEQVRWVTAQVASASCPVVIVAHHHCVPVGIQFDAAQVDERDALRKLILDNKHVVAYLHGHAHLDRWWRYGHTDIVAVRARAYRTVTFRDGRVAASVLDGQPDTPQPFVPRYLSGRCPHPGRVTYAQVSDFTNPWELEGTPCFAWTSTESGDVELQWSMRVPADVCAAPQRLRMQVRCEGATCVEVTSPDRDQPATTEVGPCPDGRVVELDLGSLASGYTDVRFTCRDGWGLVAITAPLQSAG